MTLISNHKQRPEGTNSNTANERLGLQLRERQMETETEAFTVRVIVFLPGPTQKVDGGHPLGRERLRAR